MMTEKQSIYKDKKSTVGITTGFEKLDNLIGGLQKSDLLIIASRPSMGKTALMLNIAVNCCKSEEVVKENGCIAIFSLAMSASQLTNMVISMEADVKYKNVRNGTISQNEYERIMQFTGIDGKKLKLFIDDTVELSIADLQERARRLASEHKLKAIFVDYYQLITSDDDNGSFRRMFKFFDIMVELKNLANELNIPVVVLSQLPPDIESRDDKRPVLSDLRDAEIFEPYADVVMFVYREEYYVLRSQPKEGTAEHREWQKKMDKVLNQAEVIVAKTRNGQVGTAKLYFDYRTTKFDDKDMFNY